MAESELSPNPEQARQFQEVEQLPFEEVKRGSEIQVFISQSPDVIPESPSYTIKVNGIRKDGLRVDLIEPYLQLTARMPGGFRAIRPDQPRDFEPGVTPGIIKVATETEENCLYFENLKQVTGQDNPGDSKSMRTAAIRKILFKK